MYKSRVRWGLARTGKRPKRPSNFEPFCLSKPTSAEGLGLGSRVWGLGAIELIIRENSGRPRRFRGWDLRHRIHLVTLAMPELSAVSTTYRVPCWDMGVAENGALLGYP